MRLKRYKNRSIVPIKLLKSSILTNSKLLREEIVIRVNNIKIISLHQNLKNKSHLNTINLASITKNNKNINKNILLRNTQKSHIKLKKKKLFRKAQIKINK